MTPVYDKNMSGRATHWCVLSCRRRWDPFHCQMVSCKKPAVQYGLRLVAKAIVTVFRADNAMYMGITLVILMDMYNHLAEKDKKYFRESREAMFKGQKLEDVRPVALCSSAACQIACFHCIVSNMLVRYSTRRPSSHPA